MKEVIEGSCPKTTKNQEKKKEKDYMRSGEKREDA